MTFDLATLVQPATTKILLVVHRPSSSGHRSMVTSIAGDDRDERLQPCFAGVNYRSLG